MRMNNGAARWGPWAARRRHGTGIRRCGRRQRTARTRISDTGSCHIISGFVVRQTPQLDLGIDSSISTRKVPARISALRLATISLTSAGSLVSNL